MKSTVSIFIQGSIHMSFLHISAQLFIGRRKTGVAAKKDHKK